MSQCGPGNATEEVDGSQRRIERYPVWTKGRIITVVCAVFFLGVGFLFLLGGIRGQRDFERWQTARPIDVAVDLSKPGQLVLPLNQTCSSAHSQIIALRLPPELLKQHSALKLLEDIEATLTIMNTAGSNVVDQIGVEIGWLEDHPEEPVSIFSFAPFRKGMYQATISVNHGASALTGISQQLESRYQLCGCEVIGANIVLVLGFSGMGLGVTIGLWTGFSIARGRRRSNQCDESASPTDSASPPTRKS